MQYEINSQFIDGAIIVTGRTLADGRVVAVFRAVCSRAGRYDLALAIREDQIYLVIRCGAWKAVNICSADDHSLHMRSQMGDSKHFEHSECDWVANHALQQKAEGYDGNGGTYPGEISTFIGSVIGDSGNHDAIQTAEGIDGK